MIESIYWKEDLIKLSKKLKSKRKIYYFSEKKHVNLEKQIILSFFIIRKLMELKSKLTRNIYKYKTQVIRYPSKENSQISKINDIFIENHYQIDKPENKMVDINFIANQLIHHEIIFLIKNEHKRYDTIVVCSDFEQDNYLYEISINAIIEILDLVGNDEVTHSIYTYDKKKNDYKIINN